MEAKKADLRLDKYAKDQKIILSEIAGVNNVICAFA